MARRIGIYDYPQFCFLGNKVNHAYLQNPAANSFNVVIVLINCSKAIWKQLLLSSCTGPFLLKIELLK